MDMLFHATHGVDNSAQFKPFAAQVLVELWLKFWGDQWLTILGSPDQMVVELPVRHTVFSLSGSSEDGSPSFHFVARCFSSGRASHTTGVSLPDEPFNISHARRRLKPSGYEMEAPSRGLGRFTALPLRSPLL